MATVAEVEASIRAELRLRGIDLWEMRGEAHLEIASLGGGRDLDGTAAARTTPVWLEAGDARPRPIQPLRGRSGVRYFLDGAQRTLPTYFGDSTPVFIGIVAAAILERDGDGRCSVCTGTLRFDDAWIVPERLQDPTIQHIAEVVRAKGNRVVDPLADRDDATVVNAMEDFDCLQELALNTTGKLRQDLEDKLLQQWSDQAHDGWLLVDGALRRPKTRTVGLVKSFNRLYLSGDDATRLLRLPAGERTGAFQVVDGWREDEEKRVTAWYQRFWDATGRSPRHSLVRVETAPTVTDPDEIDRIASWLHAERTPRATADARWATLLYPVHFLEQILKRQIEAQTRGWPSLRQGR